MLVPPSLLDDSNGSLPVGEVPICMSARNLSSYLTTLGEAVHYWAYDLATVLHFIMMTGSNRTFQLVVPAVAEDEWRCNGGSCSSDGPVVSLGVLLGLPTQLELPAPSAAKVIFTSECPSAASDAADVVGARYRSSEDEEVSCKLSPVFGCSAIVHDQYRGCDSTFSYQSMRLALGAFRNLRPPTLAGSDTHQHSECGYLYVRRPLFYNGSRLYAHVSDNANDVHWWNVFRPVPLAVYGAAARAAAASHNISCLELNYDARSGDIPETEVLGALAGEDQAGGVRIHHEKRPEGSTANALEMGRAATAPLLITEIGAQWSDIVLNLRCESGAPSAILRVDAIEDEKVLWTSPPCGPTKYGRGLPESLDGSCELPLAATINDEAASRGD